MFENKKIFVFGMARSGYEVAKLLRKHNNEIVLVDAKEQDKEKVEELENLGVKVHIDKDAISYLDSSFDYVVKNPGISNENELVKKAFEYGISVINEIEVAYHFLPKVKLICVTGSNGKTTTTTIIYNMIKRYTPNCFMCGNMGIPLSKMIEEIKENDILVMEISSQQLNNFKDFKPDIAVLTNLIPVHIDFFGNYENYKNIKKRIFKNFDDNSLAILNLENEDVMNLTKDIKGRKEYFSSKRKADCYYKNGIIYYQNEPIIETKDILVKGMHNYENIMCAILVMKELNIPNNIIKEELETFKGVEHRIEFVKELNKRKFYNDSKATNTVSTKIALDSFDKPTILIMGGLDRGHSFDELNTHLEHVKYVICYGQTKERIKKWCPKECKVVDNLEEATKKAYELSDKGDIILLSPACASWDQFSSFEERGTLYKDIINKL